MSNRRRIKRRPPHHLPAAQTAIMDGVCAADQRYFRAHPTVRVRIRPAVAGEAPATDLPAGAVVRVSRIRPGVQRREFLVEGDPTVLHVIDFVSFT